ncbi:PSD1 and planctomycete cytochrome C domain-containing protein [Verrucomicrobiota bacterium sgz303538]
MSAPLGFLSPRSARTNAGRHITITAALGIVLQWTTGVAAEPTASGLEFFEKKVRPVLVSECFECHAGDKHKGGLLLDSREGLLKGGDTGPAIVPGKPDESLLISSIRHDDPDLKMPSKAPKLDDAVIADLTAWVKMGAPDPRDRPEPVQAGDKKPWADLLAARRQWWSFQPVKKPEVPSVKDETWSDHPIDRFLLARMEAHGLKPAPDADPRILIRRLSVALTGLPPTPEEADAFASEYAATPIENRKSKIENWTARLLASPRFGERWARHWMDLVRYADTHGSEGDPEIPQAWRYRDYLIRAFNDDVACDQLIREHLAGDLLSKPRRNRAEGINESVLGLANLRLSEHGFQPVDTFEEQIRTVENQIDVLSKAFQGLTVSCARCHDHKFDPISQKDYYALFGILASSRPAQVTIDPPEILASRDGELAALKGGIQDALTDAWRTSAATISERLLKSADDDPLTRAVAEVKNDRSNPLYPWARLAKLNPQDLPAEWAKLQKEWRENVDTVRTHNREKTRTVWDFAEGAEKQWFRYGLGLWDGVTHPGDFTVEPEGDLVLSGVEPKGVFTGLLSRKHNGIFTSPRFRIETDRISVKASGGGGAWVRLIVDNYPLSLNPTFPRAQLKPGAPAWVTLDTAYRKGAWAYLEFATIDDLTRYERPEKQDGRSWFGVERVAFHDKEAPGDEPLALEPLLSGNAPHSAEELASRYQQALTDAIAAWRMWAPSPAQRALLNFFVRHDLLPRTLPALPNAAGAVAEYRRLENEVPVPRRAPGVMEGTSWDAPFMTRGDHKHPGDPVPRRYLEVLGSQNYNISTSGRLELANEITSPANPLTARVMVNRIWLQLFGRGLVPTPDSFGRLGEKPTHPELLDFLATRFVEDGWSFKKMIRFIVTSRAWQLSSEAAPEAGEHDAANELYTHARVRRLDAEAIRDSLLAVSGKLDLTMFGPSIEGNTSPRRSVYLTVRRTKLNPFLGAFDAPKPFTTLGHRETTNVPAQSLTLLNDPFVIDAAKRWARALLKTNADTPPTRVRAMFEDAFTRAPSEDELAAAAAYLAALGQTHGVADNQLLTNERVWQDFAQSLFNLKEFIYVR